MNLPVVCLEVGIELSGIVDTALFQYVQHAFLFVRRERAFAFSHAVVSPASEPSHQLANGFLHQFVGHPVQHPDETERIGQFIGRAEISTSVGLLLLVFRADDVPQFDFVADLLFCDSPQASSGFGAILFHAEQIGGGNVGGVDFLFNKINVL